MARCAPEPRPHEYSRRVCATHCWTGSEWRRSDGKTLSEGTELTTGREAWIVELIGASGRDESVPDFKNAGSLLRQEFGGQGRLGLLLSEGAHLAFEGALEGWTGFAAGLVGSQLGLFGYAVGAADSEHGGHHEIGGGEGWRFLIARASPRAEFGPSPGAERWRCPLPSGRG